MTTINLGDASALATPDAPADISEAAAQADPAAPQMVLLLTSAKDGLKPTVVSARCTHQGCNILTGGSWGSTEFPFYDATTHVVTCPCHGSQFNLHDGTVVNGPALTPLPLYMSRIVDNELLVDF